MIGTEIYKSKITAEKAMNMLKTEGINVTAEEAEKILEFLRLLAEINFSNYLAKK